MNVAYSGTFSLDGEDLIQKGSSPGGAVIPEGISARAISVYPTKVDGAFPTYYVKGIHSSSVWVPVETGAFVMTGIADGPSLYFYVRSDSAITMNVVVKGEV